MSGCRNIDFIRISQEFQGNVTSCVATSVHISGNSKRRGSINNAVSQQDSWMYWRIFRSWSDSLNGGLEIGSHFLSGLLSWCCSKSAPLFISGIIRQASLKDEKRWEVRITRETYNEDKKKVLRAFIGEPLLSYTMRVVKYEKNDLQLAAC